MSTKNNFDISSTGTDIEVSVFRDTDRSQRDFDDNIKMLRHSGYSTTSIGYYVDNGNVPDHDEIKFIVKGNKKDLLKFVLAEGNYYAKNEITKMKKAELQEAAIDSLGYHEKISLLTLEDINKYNLKDSNLELIADKALECVNITGYSQGDYAKVWYCPEDLQKAWGNAPDKEKLKEEFTHYFYDAPVYGEVIINGKEYHYSDMPEYQDYEWEGDKFAAYVAKESGVDVETIKKLLPKHPDYL